MRGLKTTLKYHEEHTGLAYDPFKIKEGEEPKVVRVLAFAEPPDEDGEHQGRPVIQSLFIHNKFKVLNSTRCPSDEDERDTEKCPLCRVNAPRSLRTFIPVRVRKDENSSRVQVIEYGRNSLAEVQNIVEEMDGTDDLTNYDIKIKRIGKGTKTTYKWIIVQGSKRPLNEAELALVVPDISVDFPIKDETELEKLAMQYERSSGAKKVKGDDDDDDDGDDDGDTEREELPF